MLRGGRARRARRSRRRRSSTRSSASRGTASSRRSTATGSAAAATPQAFRADVLRRALAPGGEATDEAALCERLGIPVAVVPVSRLGFKITTPEDLELAEAILARRATMTVRVGHRVRRASVRAGPARSGSAASSIPHGVGPRGPLRRRRAPPRDRRRDPRGRGARLDRRALPGRDPPWKGADSATVPDARRGELARERGSSIGNVDAVVDRGGPEDRAARDGDPRADRGDPRRRAGRRQRPRHEHERPRLPRPRRGHRGDGVVLLDRRSDAE